MESIEAFVEYWLSQNFSRRRGSRPRAFDCARIVIPLFHRLEDLLFAQRDLILLKIRREQHVPKMPSPSSKSFERRFMLTLPCVPLTSEPRPAAKKASRSSELIRQNLFRPPRAKKYPGEIGEAFLALPGPGIRRCKPKRDVDQRQFTVRHDVNNRPALELHANCRRRRLIIQRRKFQFLGPGGDRWFIDQSCVFGVVPRPAAPRESLAGLRHG